MHANTRIRRDHARLLERPTTWKRLPGTMTPGQMKRLVEAPCPDHGALWLRDRAMLELMYAAGLRASEVGALKLNEYDPKLAILKVTGKGNKQRIVPIGQPAVDATERYLAELRPHLARHNDGRDRFRVLLSVTGRPLERVAVWQIVTRVARAAGIEGVHPHLLRHSFATHLVGGGADELVAGAELASFAMRYENVEGEVVERELSVRWRGGSVQGEDETPADDRGVYVMTGLVDAFLGFEAGADFCDGALDATTAQSRILAAAAQLEEIAAALGDDGVAAEAKLQRKLEENVRVGGRGACVAGDTWAY
jgi:hypothetical protein